MFRTSPKGLLSGIKVYIALVVLVALFLLHPMTLPDSRQWGRETVLPLHITSSEHPIVALAYQYKARFRKLIEEQSQNYEDAVAEYTRRYRRGPPPGFDKWYAYARKHNSAIIDDYDIINEAMEPYWNFSPAQITDMVTGAWRGPKLHNLTIQNGHINVSHDNELGELMAKTLADVEADIPNLHLLMNPLDEPRTLPMKDVSVDVVEWKDQGHRSTWNSVSAVCSNEQQTANQDSADGGLPFVTDVHAAKDVCQHTELENMHGFFMSPTTFLYTNQPVPILSQAAASTFGDILYPSPYYWEAIDDNLTTYDLDWSSKKAQLYWKGSTTGGWVTKNSAAGPMHRQRFVSMANGMNHDDLQFLNESTSGHWELYTSQDVLEKPCEVGFTHVTQCDKELCDDVKAEFGMSKTNDKSVAYKYRFLMDLDGNSFSGRFYNFLASNSLPLKQTIFKEWHDERLMPWVHYVPVSMSMDELPEILRFLSQTEAGNLIAQEIAEAGKEWRFKMLREEDAAIYLYRLFLEYARVASNDRDSMG